MQFLLNDFSDQDLQFVINSLCILRVHFSTVFFSKFIHDKRNNDNDTEH